VAIALDELDPKGAPPATAQHAHHLRALAALWLGDVARALAAVDAVLRVDGGCALSATVALVDALEKKPAGAMGAYVRRVTLADGWMAHGDASAARDLLDSAHARRAFDPQAVTRLAAAGLKLVPRTPAERFRKRLARAAACAPN